MSGHTHTLKASSLFALAKVTGFEPEWLLSGKGPPRKDRVIDQYQDGHTATVLECMEKLSYDEKAIIAKIASAMARKKDG